MTKKHMKKLWRASEEELQKMLDDFNLIIARTTGKLKLERTMHKDDAKQYFYAKKMKSRILTVLNSKFNSRKARVGNL